MGRPVPKDPVRSRLFSQWVGDPDLRESCSFLEYVDQMTDEHGRLMGEYERAEREAIQGEVDDG